MTLHRRKCIFPSYSFSLRLQPPAPQGLNQEILGREAGTGEGIHFLVFVFFVMVQWLFCLSGCPVFCGFLCSSWRSEMVLATKVFVPETPLVKAGRRRHHRPQSPKGISSGKKALPMVLDSEQRRWDPWHPSVRHSTRSRKELVLLTSGS